MLTGQLPYDADTPIGMAIRHINDPVPEIHHVEGKLPPDCQKIIDRVMAKEREFRYFTATALSADLTELANNHSLKSLNAQNLKPDKHARRHSSPPAPALSKTQRERLAAYPSTNIAVEKTPPGRFVEHATIPPYPQKLSLKRSRQLTSQKWFWPAVAGVSVLGILIVLLVGYSARNQIYALFQPKSYIVANFYDDVNRFDPALDYQFESAEIIQNSYETLVTYERENASIPVPQLASEWQVSDDGLSYTFTIREGVTFHEGDELTAQDVTYSLQRALLLATTQSPQLEFLAPLLGMDMTSLTELFEHVRREPREEAEEVEPAQLIAVCKQIQSAMTADGNTVTIKLAQAWSPLPLFLAMSWASIMDMDWVIAKKGWNGDCASLNFKEFRFGNNFLTINGTGPYKLKMEDSTEGQQILLVANQTYWRDEEIGPAWPDGPIGTPAIERIVFKNIDQWGTASAALQEGEADSALVDLENKTNIEALVGERCYYNFNTLDFDCNVIKENPDGPLRLYVGYPHIERFDAVFLLEINHEGGNPFIGSGQLDGQGIPANFFSDPNVRRAFNYCFDSEQYIADYWQGEAVENVGLLLPGMIGYNPNGRKYQFNLDKCKEELELAWKGQVAENGFRIHFPYPTDDPLLESIAEILKSNLAKVHPQYEVVPNALEGVEFERELEQKRLPLFIASWDEEIYDPHNLVQPFLVGKIATDQQLPEEMIAEFKALVDAGIAENDPQARQAIYEQLTQLDYEQAIAIRLAVPSGRRYEQRRVKGWYYNPAYAGTYYYALDK